MTRQDDATGSPAALPEPGATARARGDVPPIPESTARWVRPLLRWFSKANVFVYRLTNGKLWGTFPGGVPVCLVSMTGAKSGRKRTIPLIYLPHGEEVILVASQGGMEKHPIWYWNLKKDPHVTIQDGARKRRMVARQVDDAEKRELWPHILTIYPDFEDYQARTDRNIPMFVCSLESGAS